MAIPAEILTHILVSQIEHKSYPILFQLVKPSPYRTPTLQFEIPNL